MFIYVKLFTNWGGIATIRMQEHRVGTSNSLKNIHKLQLDFFSSILLMLENLKISLELDRITGCILSSLNMLSLCSLFFITCITRIQDEQLRFIALQSVGMLKHC